MSDGVRGYNWALVIFGAVLVLIGLALAIGGIWLIILGGSFYYALAGAALALAGSLLMVDRIAGAWIYFVLFVATVIWAVWEVGFNGLALVPRIVGPLVLALIILCFVHCLRRLNGDRKN